MTSKATLLWAVALILALPAFLFPLSNPDIFWHLSAGRWIIEHHAVPRTDFLSFSMPGTDWVDFEWLSQLLFQLLYQIGGMTALWLLKISLLLASWLIVDRFLTRRQVIVEARILALALWSVGMLAHSDIRPELFSILFFSLLVTWLEDPQPLPLVKVFALFALWANLHAGFIMGLALILLYRRAWTAALAVAGTLVNPYFFRPYQVLWQHFAQRADLAHLIKEWEPLSFGNPLNWPFWPMILVVFILAIRSRQIRTLTTATLLLAASSIMHERNSLFFAVLAATLAGLSIRKESLRRTLAASLTVYAVFLLWLFPRTSWSHIFNDKHVPRAATAFLAKERTVLEPLRLYNQWEWGGYLGWKLAPWYRVFCDGRYIFHSQLAETGLAVENPALWQKFTDQQGLSGALMLNLDRQIPARKRYPDGSLKDFPRPWYVFYMPKDRWALVYWDEKALLFVDRSRVPAPWLSEHEYRYVHPKDDAAFQEALRLREIPVDAVGMEAQRHSQELADFAGAKL